MITFYTITHICLLLWVFPQLCLSQQCNQTKFDSNCPKNSYCNQNNYCQCLNGFICDCQTSADELNQTLTNYTLVKDQDSVYVVYPESNESIYFYQFNFCQSPQYGQLTYQLALYFDEGQSQKLQEKNLIDRVLFKEKKNCWSVLTPFLRFERLKNGAITRLVIKVRISGSQLMVSQSYYKVQISVQDNGYIDFQILWIMLYSFVSLASLSLIGSLIYCIWWIKVGRHKNRNKNNIDHLEKYFPQIKLTTQNINEFKNKEPSCVICLVEFQNKQKIRKLICNHIYHSKCLDQWCEVKLSCPACRISLQLADIEQQIIEKETQKDRIQDRSQTLSGQFIIDEELSEEKQKKSMEIKLLKTNT